MNPHINKDSYIKCDTLTFAFIIAPMENFVMFMPKKENGALGELKTELGNIDVYMDVKIENKVFDK